VLLWASRRRWIKRAVTAAPVTRGVVRRFVAGENIDDAVRVACELTSQGMLVSLDHLGEDTTDREHAQRVVNAYVELLVALERADLVDRIGPLTARSAGAEPDQRIGT